LKACCAGCAGNAIRPKAEVPFSHASFPFSIKLLSSQVKLLISNNAFFIVQRATARSKTEIFRDCGLAEAPPGFQAGWSECMSFFSLFLFIFLLIWSL
jgi:hypothetical protein